MSGIGYPRHINFRDGSFVSVKNAEEEAEIKRTRTGWFEFPDCPKKKEADAPVIVEVKPAVVIELAPEPVPEPESAPEPEMQKRKAGRPAKRR